ncbi:hypothetical protein RhiirA5_444435 [Rhizophagus irregularis]|uniref:Uncharacterized protein n=1 Tax=Rhizophagus irregularis TaxID=588596 RepID=A0A2N0NDA0_9GLOM|nr:hypothetical protein RhiirA5_444435 [Rhizophagus irregularis]
MNIFGQMNMILHHQIYQHNHLMNHQKSQAEKNIFNHGQGIVASPDNGNIHNYELESSNNVNMHNHGREFVESSNNENIHNHGQEIVEPPSNERIFNHGREIV